MNEYTIPYVLTDEEACLLDEMYLKNKSLISQMNVLKQLSDLHEDQIYYYINTLVEELLAKNDASLNKYLKAIMKDTDIPTNILVCFLKVLYVCQHKIDEYEAFRRSCILLFIKHNFDYETVLKDFI